MFACIADEIEGNLDGSNIEEGLPAEIGLKISVEDREVTKGVLANEQALSNLHVLIFDGTTGNIVTNKHISNFTTNPVYVSTTSGANRKIFVYGGSSEVANATTALSSVLKYSDLNTLKIQTDVTDSLGLANGLMSQGEVTATINPGTTGNSVTVPLHFLQARINVTVNVATPAGITVTPLAYDIVNLPNITYLKEQTQGSLTTPGPDAFDTTNVNHFFTSTNRFKFDPVPGNSNSVTAKFYMFENRRGGQWPRTGTPPFSSAQLASNPSLGKAWYAPPKATYMVIHCLYDFGGTNNTQLLDLYLYMGKDNFGDYNVARTTEHNYVVTIKDKNQITIDSNVSPSSSGFSVTLGNLTLMDSHPDMRAIVISGNLGMATVEIVNGGTTNTWMKVSPLDLMYHQVKQSGNDPAGNPTGYWQQDGPIGNFVRPKYIPHKSYRSANPTKKWDGWDYVVNQGLDNDDTLTYVNATYRMCYKITDIPFTSINTTTTKTIYVYADNFPVENGSRLGMIKVTYKRNGETVAESRFFTLNQQGSTYIGLGVNTYDSTVVDPASSITYKKLYVDRVNEVQYYLDPSLPTNVQSTTTMQWGYNTFWLNNPGASFTIYRNGFFQTANIVYGQGTSNWVDGNSNFVSKNNQGGNVSWSNLYNTYRTKYGGAVASGSLTTPIVEPTTVSNSGYPYYRPDITAHIYHPIWKSSGARYCHEKNRDVNGDGIIDESETSWYMPALNETQLMFITKSGTSSANWGSTWWILDTTESGTTSWWFINHFNANVNGAGKSGSSGVMYARCIYGIPYP